MDLRTVGGLQADFKINRIFFFLFQENEEYKLLTFCKKYLTKTIVWRTSRGPL